MTMFLIILFFYLRIKLLSRLVLPSDLSLYKVGTFPLPPSKLMPDPPDLGGKFRLAVTVALELTV